MIGLDLDNTLACYDGLFYRLAVEHCDLPPETAPTKSAVRDYLRSVDQEDRWTALQGRVYGSQMSEAPPFPGVREFLLAARVAGKSLVIVSHRTRRPYAGPAADLHESARSWIRSRLVDEQGRPLLDDHDVYLEERREDKLARIGTLGCEWFVDDLPELLADPAFPREVRRILFDPEGRHTAVAAEVGRTSSWEEIARWLL